VFFCGEVYSLSSSSHLLRKPIEFQVCDSKNVRPADRTSSEQSLHSRQEFSERKWFREVVVRSGLQMFDLVGQSIPGSEHEDRHTTVSASNLAKDTRPAQRGQHQVQNDQVVVVALGEFEPGSAICRRIYCKALRDQSPSYHTTHLLFVFDEQNSHRLNLPSKASTTRLIQEKGKIKFHSESLALSWFDFDRGWAVPAINHQPSWVHAKGAKARKERKRFRSFAAFANLCGLGVKRESANRT